jgi:rRNA-processing protein EBP2
MEEEASKKASEAAKRQRDLKKFGKQVQVSKIQEREKQKGQVLEKIKALKRSNPHQSKLRFLLTYGCVERQNGGMLTTEDDFEVELEEASRAEKGPRPKLTRERRNDKYGYGGSKKKFKRNDDDDAGDLSVFDKRGKGERKGKKSQRPGKSRRMQRR